MIRPFIPLATVFVAVALPAYAQNSLVVRVVDEAGQPIAGAVVAGRVLSNEVIELRPQNTDAKGEVSFSMANDKEGKPTAGSVVAGAKGYSFGGVSGTSGPLAVPIEIRLSRGQTWRGKVVDDKGAPLSGTRVYVNGAIQGGDSGSEIYVRDGALGTLYSAKSGADGSFEIPDLPANMQLIYGAILPNFALARGQNAKVGVTELIILKPGGAIKGRALDVAGKPLAGVNIYARSTDYMGHAYTTTQSDGSFTIEGLTPGTYQFSAVSPSGAVFVLPRLKDMRVVAGATATAPEWRAQTGIEISGVVRDAITKKPIAGAYFGAQSEEDRKTNDDSAFVSSDKEGRFVMRVLPGEYNITSRGVPQGYLNAGIAQSVEAKAGAPVQISFTLQAAPVLRGITRDESGQPVAAKLVIGGVMGQKVTSDAQGQWQYTPNDTDDIGIGGGENEDGYFEVVSPKRVDWPAKGPIVVTVRRKPWQKLEGRVVTPEGTPIEGVKVEAEFSVPVDDNTSLGARVSASSDKEGRYVLERLRDSRRPNVGGTEVEVSAKKDGYQYQSGGVVTRVGKEPRVSDLIFAPLSAQINGVTLAGADVVVAGRQTRADEAGHFSFDALPAGKNIVYAAKDNLFGSAPSSLEPLEIKLSKLAPQGQDETLAREIWDKAMAGKTDDNTLDLDQWREGGGEGFLAQLRRAQKTGYAWQIASALGQWKSTNSPESLVIAREIVDEMESLEARTDAVLALAVSSGAADLTASALELTKSQFAAQTTDTRRRENQLYLTAVLTERHDGAQAGAFALRTALAYTLQTHPANSRVEDARQIAVGRNEALADAASIVAQGSPALLNELLETIEPGSGFALRALGNAIPVVARARGFEAAAPLLEELRTMPEPSLDLKIRYTDFDPAWSYGQAVNHVLPLIGPTDAGAAMALARKVVGDDEQRGRALARAARYQSLDVAAAMLREATEKISSEDAPRVALAAYERDAKLGLELFEIARQKADADMKSNQKWRNSWIPFAFNYARANPAGARLILEREWATNREAKADTEVLAAIAIAMARVDAQRATEMARVLGGSWGVNAQIKIARYLVADDETRRGFVFEGIGARDGWDVGDLQW